MTRDLLKTLARDLSGVVVQIDRTFLVVVTLVAVAGTGRRP